MRDLPAPVGAVNRIGAFELDATCSIRSIKRLKAGLRISIPRLEDQCRILALADEARSQAIVFRQIEIDDLEGPRIERSILHGGLVRGVIIGLAGVIGGAITGRSEAFFMVSE